MVKDTSEFSGMIESDQLFELATDPESNIVCFRYAHDGFDETTLNKINAAIRDTIIKEGSFYIVQAELDGKIWLRLTIINPVTSLDDLKALLIRISELGAKIGKNV
jgi:L-2,4-diaminobutyrate decarboxylase